MIRIDRCHRRHRNLADRIESTADHYGATAARKLGGRLPNVRILLTASEEARLTRRAREMHGSTDAAAVEATRALVVGRDKVDAAVTSFLEAADGVVTIDSSALAIDETVGLVLGLVERSR